jgi:hypothetical protein
MKLERILLHLRAHPKHPINAISAEFGHLKVNWLIGYMVPFLCILVLLLGALFGTMGVLQFGGK